MSVCLALKAGATRESLSMRYQMYNKLKALKKAFIYTFQVALPAE